MTDTSTKAYIIGIVYTIFSIIVIAFAWINKYLLSTIYFAIFFYAVMVLLVIVSIGVIIVAYYDKKQRQEEREKLAETLEGIIKEEEQQEIQQLKRDKQEIMNQANRLMSQYDQTREEERRLELEKQNLELARQRLELFRQYDDLERNRVNYALETAHQMVDMLHPDADKEAKEAIVKGLIPTLLRFSEGPEIPGSPRFVVDFHRDENLAIAPQQQPEEA